MSRRAGTSPGWIAGALSMIVMSTAMLAARLVVGVPTLPEMFSDTILYLVPTPVFVALLDTLRSAGKPLLLFVLFLGQLGVGALVGRYLALPTTTAVHTHLRSDIFRMVLKRALWTCAAIWLLTIAVLMPALGVGFLGALTAAGTLATGVVYSISFLLYAVIFSWLFAELALPRPTMLPGGRRTFLKRVGWGIVGLTGAGAVIAAYGAASSSGQVTRPVARLPSPITPVGGFYVVNKDLIGVKVNPDEWNLTVVGSSGTSRTYDLPTLKAMPSVDLTSTLTCISNEIGGNLIGTARWSGVRLRDLLQEVEIGPRASSVALSAWDNYADSIPIARAMDPATVLAYAMDGAPLPDIHGFPLRLVVPGLYGIKNVKWIKRIEVLDHGFVGYWQARGWTDDATVQTQSQIDVPFDRSIFPRGPVVVGGIAFAGARGISKVELSTDGGATWLPTTLRPTLSRFTWTTWTVLWAPTTPGWYRLTVRATDGQGERQRSDVTPPIPDGATGYHSISVRVG